MMNWDTGIKWAMVISGLLTCTMFYAAIAPAAALRATFGDTLSGPLAEIVVRNWGVLVTLVGVMLVYGAYRPAVRSMALCVGGFSKLVFVGLVLTYGREYLGSAGVAVGVDLFWVAVFGTYLLTAKPQTEPEAASVI